MSVFLVPLGFNVKNNPLVTSVYDQGEANNIYPIGNEKDLLTEADVFIMTEDFKFITTE